ncbi:IS5 family transposase (plasmid) [Rhizobium leguminosarum]|nr:IS5 family transposase [Rhizobium leguminosarum]
MPPANPITRYSAMKSARALGFATSRHLHHVPGHDLQCADRRDKITKQKYQVTNWPAYNESLRQRGDLNIWVKDEALALWTARRRTSRGGQPKYSDLAITLCLTLRVVYGLALRQTQGLMRIGFDIAVPDFSTLSRRSKGLALPSTKCRATTSGPVHLVVDSTGLKVFGEGEWLENKHKTKAKRKRWRKLHLGLNLVSGEIVCSDLTVDDVGDPTALPGLLDQIGGPVEKFIASLRRLRPRLPEELSDSHHVPLTDRGDFPMTSSANLFLRQTHSLVLTPRLMQAIQSLQMTRFELRQFITLEVEKNPLLEFRSNDGETGDDEQFGRLPEDAGADDRYDNRTGARSSEWSDNASTSRLE